MNDQTDGPWLTPPQLAAYGDAPIEAIGKDAFDLARKIGPLYDMIRHPATQMPLTIAIYGDWGSGKTSAMKVLQERLAHWTTQGKDAKTQGKDAKKVSLLPVWFDPWKYHDRDDVRRGLIAEVIRACLSKQEPDDVKGKILEAASFVGRPIMRLVRGLKIKAAYKDVELELPTLDEVFAKTPPPDTEYLNDFEESLKTWVKETLGQNERLVVFIDDLDRCLPDVALQVLEALKLYLGLPQLIFVVGLDRGVVSDVVRKYYEDQGVTEEKASKYLDKMFQVEASLAPSDRQVNDYLATRLKSPIWDGLPEQDRGIFLPVFEHLGRGSPREIGRLVDSAMIEARGATFMLQEEQDPPWTAGDAIHLYLVQRLIRPSESDAVRDDGISFFSAWSEARRAHPDAPNTYAINEEDIAAIRAFLEKTAQSDPGRTGLLKGGPENDDRLPERISAMPETYRRVVMNPRHLRLLRYLGNTHLGGLMARAFPTTLARAVAPLKGGAPTIILEAIARAMNLESTDDVTSDHWRTVTDLDLSDNDLSEITLLQECVALQTLELNNTQVADLAPLKGLTALQSLWLDNTQVADLAPLKGLTALETLWLNYTQVADLAPLKGLTALETLWLNNTPVADLAPLKGLTALQTLELDNTPVADLAPLKGLTALQSLQLYNTPVADLAPLNGLTALQMLWLNDTQVADLAPLKGLTALQMLYLNNTQVADLAPLNGLTALQTLTLNNTQVADLTPLKGLIRLKRLSLNSTPVNRQQIEALQAVLPDLTIEIDNASKPASRKP
ncbi:MAG: P-loop NTPase fold protein [Alphaproteobacteria bacterium]